MKILVCFKEYNLGTLFLKDNQVYYNSNADNENEFRKNFVSSSFYTLFDSNNKELNVLPEFLQQFLEMTKNDYYKKLANINKQDSDFVKLYKLSKLNLDDFGFYIKSE